MRYLVPIAAEDTFFPRSEYHFPKPLVEIDGEPMISRVIDNITAADRSARFIFVIREKDSQEFGLDLTLKAACEHPCVIIQIDSPTAGAACTALLAIDHINDSEPLVICNGDQIIEADIAEALSHFAQSDVDAGVLTFPSVHPRWSYVSVDPTGMVLEAAEKRVISRNAIAGFYYFMRGSDFVEAAKKSMINDRSHQGTYYISEVLNELILMGAKVGSHHIASDEYQSLFSPQRLDNYERGVQKSRLESGRDKAAVTVVIPMAGLGSRFADAGYAKPKPFIDVAGKPMIERVIDNLHVPGAQYLLIARQEHLAAEPESVQKLLARGDVKFVTIDYVTEGAACTVLTAARLWDPSRPLLIANCDQIVDFSAADFVSDAKSRKLDGSILTFHDPSRDPKWSFARVADSGLVEEVKEKVAISDVATVGLYYFATAQEFQNSASEMIMANDRVNNEFYVCPVYNYAIRSGARIGQYMIPAEAMHGIGTPPDLEAFLKLRYPE